MASEAEEVEAAAHEDQAELQAVCAINFHDGNARSDDFCSLPYTSVPPSERERGDRHGRRAGGRAGGLGA